MRVRGPVARAGALQARSARAVERDVRRLLGADECERRKPLDGEDPRGPDAREPHQTQVREDACVCVCVSVCVCERECVCVCERERERREKRREEKRREERDRESMGECVGET